MCGRQKKATAICVIVALLSLYVGSPPTSASTSPGCSYSYAGAFTITYSTDQLATSTDRVVLERSVGGPFYWRMRLPAGSGTVYDGAPPNWSNGAAYHMVVVGADGKVRHRVPCELMTFATSTPTCVASKRDDSTYRVELFFTNELPQESSSLAGTFVIARQTRTSSPYYWRGRPVEEELLDSASPTGDANYAWVTFGINGEVRGFGPCTPRNQSDCKLLSHVDLLPPGYEPLGPAYYRGDMFFADAKGGFFVRLRASADFSKQSLGYLAHGASKIVIFDDAAWVFDDLLDDGTIIGRRNGRITAIAPDRSVATTSALGVHTPVDGGQVGERFYFTAIVDDNSSLWWFNPATNASQLVAADFNGQFRIGNRLFGRRTKNTLNSFSYFDLQDEAMHEAHRISVLFDNTARSGSASVQSDGRRGFYFEDGRNFAGSARLYYFDVESVTVELIESTDSVEYFEIWKDERHGRYQLPVDHLFVHQSVDEDQATRRSMINLQTRRIVPLSRPSTGIATQQLTSGFSWQYHDGSQNPVSTYWGNPSTTNSTAYELPIRNDAGDRLLGSGPDGLLYFFSNPQWFWDASETEARLYVYDPRCS